MNLSFNELRQANTARCEKSFHSINSWTPTDWACAMAGECGEACNLVKKFAPGLAPVRSPLPPVAGLGLVQLLQLDGVDRPAVRKTLFDSVQEHLRHERPTSNIQL